MQYLQAKNIMTLFALVLVTVSAFAHAFERDLQFHFKYTVST